MKINKLGLSLVEFMVAMFLSVFITSTLITLFISQKATYRYVDGMARLQENSRFLSYTLTNEIRMAGFLGCQNMHSITPQNLVSNPQALLNVFNNTSILGYEASGPNQWQPALPTFLQGKVKSGTDVIVIYRGQPNAKKMSKNMNQPSNDVELEDKEDIIDGDILLISDCTTADIFKAANSSSTNIIKHTTTYNTSANLSKAYTMNASVTKYEAKAFYIADSGRLNMTGLPIHSLYQSDMHGNALELVEGVENLQISYGLDTTDDNNVDEFASANTVSTGNNFSKVISIKINALVNSVEEITNKPEKYVFMGSQLTPNDKILRKSWQSYIGLRNIK